MVELIFDFLQDLLLMREQKTKKSPKINNIIFHSNKPTNKISYQMYQQDDEFFHTFFQHVFLPKIFHQHGVLFECFANGEILHGGYNCK